MTNNAQCCAWIAAGSNLGDSQAVLEQAVRRLDTTPGMSVAACSSLYQTPPWGDENQSDFLNAVVQLTTHVGAVPLLRQLQAIEGDAGRVRTQRRWGPRILDLDLLMYGQMTLAHDELTLPHPRMHERAFVLVPLLELAPDLNIPGRGVVSELLGTLPSADIVRLGPLIKGKRR